jgi:hypothetical protein
MERETLLIARIDLYRRYLSEGADGDVALAYLWQIKQDEAELMVLAVGHDKERRDTTATGRVLSPASQSELKSRRSHRSKPR